MSVKLYANINVMEVGDVDFADGYTLYDARYVLKAGDTMSGALLIHGGANTLQLKVKGHASQSASLQEWQSSGGAVLAKVASDGALTVGDSSDARMFIGPAANADGYHWAMRYAGSSAPAGMMQVYFSKTIAEDAGFYYMQNVLFDASVDGGHIANAQTGLQYVLTKAGAGEQRNLIGMSFSAVAAGSGITGNAVGARVYVFSDATNSLANGYGLYVQAFTKASGASFTNAYGVFVDDQAAATNNYSIYTKAGDVRLMASGSDKIGFHGATPIAQQTVTGSRGGNAALASLLTKLANLGLVVDSST